LTLEHLENYYYQTFLAEFSAEDFINAGFSSSIRGRMEEIASHESNHVKVLESILGGQAVKPCTYSLYVAFAQVFLVPDEGV